jgi:hypothetical protein
MNIIIYDLFNSFLAVENTFDGAGDKGKWFNNK